MGFDEGRIVLDRENETYYAGETLRGVLEFQQDKNKTFRGIYVTVKGFAHTHWTTRHSRRGANGKTQHYTVSHDAHEDYFNTKQFLVGAESGEYHLPPGQHRFPFEAPIPAHCPSSFEGDYGHVRYELRVVVDRALRFDQEKEIRLTVVAPLDLNADPALREPLHCELEDSYCCWCVSSGTVETSVRLPASGVCPGQSLPVEVACHNRSDVTVNKIKMAIKQESRFTAHSAPGTRSGERRTIAEIKKGPIPGNTSRSWTVQLDVPDDAQPCGLANCNIIDLGYVFEVTVSPDGCHSNAEQERPLVIGTVQLAAAPPPHAPPAPPLLDLDSSLLPSPAYNPNYPYSDADKSIPAQYPEVNHYSPANRPYPYPDSNQYYAGVNMPYPGVNIPHPGENRPLPGLNMPPPSVNMPQPGVAMPLPGVNMPHPGVNMPHPGGNNPYPGWNSYAAGQNTPYRDTTQYPHLNETVQQANAPPHPNAPPTFTESDPPPYSSLNPKEKSAPAAGGGDGGEAGAKLPAPPPYPLTSLPHYMGEVGGGSSPHAPQSSADG